MIVIGFMI